jgi:hypothetical protein
MGRTAGVASPFTNSRRLRTSVVEWGVAMRETLESGIPDTAPYKEWLGLVGSMALAVLICAVLFAGAVPT